MLLSATQLFIIARAYEATVFENKVVCVCMYQLMYVGLGSGTWMSFAPLKTR